MSGDSELSEAKKLMAMQMKSIQDPATMATIHNLLRIDKLDNQHQEILSTLHEDAEELSALRRAVEELAEKFSTILPEHHEEHHEILQSKIETSADKQKQWLSIRNSALAGLAILVVTLFGQGLIKLFELYIAAKAG